LELVSAVGTREDPFATWNAETLDNGVRVWLNPRPGTGAIRVLAVVPHGSFADAPGPPGVAHLTEHLLLASGNDGTEEERKQAITDRGGSYNGHTRSSATSYWAEVPPRELDFAVAWIAETVLTMHTDASTMSGEKRAVLLEKGDLPQASALAIGKLIRRVMGRPSEPQWQHEYLGLPETQPMTRRSLMAMSPQDVKAFHARSYRPDQLLVSIVGDFDLAAGRALAHEHFGGLPAVDEPPVLAATESFDGPAAQVWRWTSGEGATYSMWLRVPNPSDEDLLIAETLRLGVQKELARRLRQGERKTIYDLSAKRFYAAGQLVLRFEMSCSVEDLEVVAGSSQALLRELTEGEHPAGTARMIQSVASLKARGATDLGELSTYVTSAPYHSMGSPPDPVGLAARLTPDALSAWMKRMLPPEHRGERRVIPQPVPPLIEWGAVIGLWMIGVFVARHLLKRRLALSQLRYLRSMRWGVLDRLFAGFVAVAVFAAVGVVMHWPRDSLLGIAALSGSYWQVFVAWCSYLFVLGMAVRLVPALFPSKLLVMESQIRLKAMSWTSIGLPRPSNVEYRSFLGVLVSRRLVLPLTLSVLSRGVVLEYPGWSLFLRTRDSGETVAVLREWLSAETSAPPNQDE
jgi:predicted Zn-dependent peptidase